MILERWVWKVKWGCEDRLIALLKEEGERQGWSSRLYTPVTGPWPTVAMDTEFESLDQREDWYTELRARPSTPAFMQKLGELVESAFCELWDVVE